MNNKSPLKKTAKKRHFFSSLFGRVHWSSPPWLMYMRQKASTNPLLFVSTVLFISAVLIGAAYTYYWYKNQPKPILVSAVITVPDITPLAETMVPNRLVLDFGILGADFKPQSVAPLNSIYKEINKGVTLNPSHPGTWIWESDSSLAFTPKEDWPAAQNYQIQFAKDFFAPNAKMESYNYTFTTKPFEAKISEFKLYQDPVNAKLIEAVATINFNFPVNTKNLENKITLQLQAIKNGKEDREAHSYKFTVSYDKYKRQAYLHSEPLTIENVSRYLVLTLDKGILSSLDTASTKESLSATLLIPDASSYFKINSVVASIIRNQEDRPEQVLSVETTLGVSEKDINQALHVYLLPKDKPATKFEARIENYEWTNARELSADDVKNIAAVDLKAIPADRNYAPLHNYKFHAPEGRYILVVLDKGVQSFGDFTLANNFRTVVKVPAFPKEISFLHKGALLALSSEKKLSVLVRGVAAVKFQIARVLPDSVNQLITQTEGDFNNPYFLNQSFNQQNISDIFSEIQQFDNSDSSKQNYSALDLEKYLANAQNAKGPRGLFLLQGIDWDISKNEPLYNQGTEIKASRLILITDLGLIVKDNNDGSHDVFVQSIEQGVPVANIEVSILGKNGLPLITRTTDEQGRASFPTLKDFVEDKEPTVYIAQQGADTSFIPFNKTNRQLNFSRFDIGGIYTNQEAGSLSAFIFSDRGIYRPGDKAHIAMIIKQAYALPERAGLPLEVTIVDPRGNTVLDEKYALDETGYISFDFNTTLTGATGQYTVTLYTVKDSQRQNFLGSTNFRVAEFQPDRMRISSELSEAKKQGWISPVGLSATVKLWNLYGAPATNRRISGKIILTPEAIKFDKYPDYSFHDPLVDPKKDPKVFTDTLADVTTNEQGDAQINLNLERFDKATYQLMFVAEGFEADGGRSVTTQSKALVSPRPYFIGYKPDGDLKYIKQATVRTVHLIAINSELQQIPVKDLKIQLVALKPVTTLIKKENGTYEYQSIVQSSVLETKPFSLNEDGMNYPLPSEKIGEYQLQVLDKANTELCRLSFNIIGASEQALAKNAELTVTLNKEEYNAGEDIELQVSSPYTGAGLITIERDKVYTAQWFKAETSNSIQKIHIPEDFQGNAYVNVAFVRDWNSPDIFMSPLSYSVIPFRVNNANHVIQIDLDTPKIARPGDTYTIGFKSDKPGKIIVYAVDEGILQVSKYQTPDPLAYFFQKRALEVITQQTVDQILPKYLQDREISSVGGDDGEDALSQHLNPFKRKTDLPVVYWSGLMDTDSNSRELSFKIPDYFNGSLRVMAVAVSDSAIGHVDKLSEVRGNFIINPNAPTFVAPGDEFEVTASIANNVQNSGDNAEVIIEVTASPELQIINSQKEHIVIPEGKERTMRFKVRASSLLGSGSLKFVATIGEKSSSYVTTLSVRPASPFKTWVNSGFTKLPWVTLPITRTLYEEYRKVEAQASVSPIILVTGLKGYLDNFSLGCTEQLISKAFPLLAMAREPEFIKDKERIGEKVNDTLQILSQRQMSSGGFSYWPNTPNNENNSFISVYAMHFLTEIRAMNYPVSNDLFFAGIGYLKELASQNVRNLEAARIAAYGIYILTKNEIVTSAYLTNLQLYLEKNYADIWKKDITGAYIAASYQLLKSQTQANDLIAQYQAQATIFKPTDFYNANIADAQYIYLLAHHFPELLENKGEKLLMPLVSAINTEDINTLSSSYTSLALASFAKVNEAHNAQISISETLANKSQKSIDKSVSPDAKSITFRNPEKQMIFYQLTEAGFDKLNHVTQMAQGMEIYREYRNADNQKIEEASLGDEIEIHIQARSLDKEYLNNIAIVDLLPGGFEVVRDSVHSDQIDYADIREDRVIFITGLNKDAKEIVYRIKAVSMGKFILPAIFAESMYFPAIKASGKDAIIEVKEK